ncbi:hypothetical protein [Burkholderia stagnalis]|uniref:N-acetyltransferase domain-containing protein n=1 Tax=Burkholderia stagnalis TaxID=1503054 RepID=A0A106NWD4_9BURK|nr:hypothetical protein [Burkholderia stagnalis]KVZ11863.1 hypothetical protein WT35_17115 [Burkholderia stagnalis]KWA55096.1 hypothetical protein WT44_28090 [Burkholderia stagnalis]KWA56769.1 hypothetical protein WT42_10045 [Burkholderia stagnalis]KWA56957.1 hypothetical protein WT43_22240 [Burkholderia stagnalis]KWC94798.1 hypothetical protein WT45_26660 [Burkholderia stagnalis]
MIEIADIGIRDFSHADIDGFIAYWYDGGDSHLAAMGVDPARLPGRQQMRDMLALNLEREARAGTPQNAIFSITLHGQTVGVHELTHLEQRAGGPPGRYASGVMHAHIWQPAHRRLGIGVVSYVKAMAAFFERFSLDAIRFESPADNVGANRVKAHLGIAPQGEGLFELPILRAPLRTVRYRVTPDQMPAITARMEAVWETRRHADAPY